MNFRAIALGSLLLATLSLLMLIPFMALGYDKATAPQLMTLSALWIAPLVLALRKVNEAGTLHGLLSGFLGSLLVLAELHLATKLYPDHTLLMQLTGPASNMILILGGLMGGASGIVVDNMRLIKAKRAARKKAQEQQQKPES